MLLMYILLILCHTLCVSNLPVLCPKSEDTRMLMCTKPVLDIYVFKIFKMTSTHFAQTWGLSREKLSILSLL